MLFNSPAFILAFLPLTLALFFAIGRHHRPAAAAFLALASLFFYGWWDVRYVPLLCASIALNFGVGSRIIACSIAEDRANARRWLIFGIVADLALLAYYKYSDLALATYNQLADTAYPALEIVLPLGISFFTFTQIAYLVDAYQGKAREYSAVHYGLFVTYFPHLIAGPILHHRQMMPQFERADVYRCIPQRLAEGGAIFMLGLAKKVVLADRFGEFAGGGFAAVASGQEITLFAAWGAVLCYTFQLYFDFSGYSDMAIGLGRMMGIELPRNFASPYKATSIIDFWRRWHMTLSAFLREYLYIPLGGNRQGPVRRHLNLMLTMLLGGLWHGANWTFVVWGGLHGLFLVINHLWREAVARLRLHGIPWPDRALRPVYWALTFLGVMVAWVFFRADSFDAAMLMLRAMSGDFGVALPGQVLQMLPPLQGHVQAMGKVPFLADGTVMGFVELVGMLGLGFFAALMMPTVLDMSLRLRRLLVVLSAALVIQRIAFGRASEFLYFQF